MNFYTYNTFSRFSVLFYYNYGQLIFVMLGHSSIQNQIHATLGDIEELRKVENHLNGIQEELKKTYDKLNIAKVNLEKELQDVNDLESLGVKSLFYKTLGSKEEQLEKERQEYLTAALHYKELKKSIDLLEFEKKVLARKTTQLIDLETKLDALKNEREQEIISTNSQLKVELKEILHKLEKDSVQGRAVDEAIVEGEKGLKHLNIVIGFLRQAKDWGRWDMYSKNRAAGYRKHQAIDKAISNITNTQHQLNKFSRELSDLGDRYYTFDLNIGQFNKFMDFFFDNLISDWIIQQRIKASLNNMERTFSAVQRIVLELKAQKENIQKSTHELLATKDRLLLNL